MGNKRFGREAWEKLCDFAREDIDSTPFISKGMWTAKKLFFLNEYLVLVTRAMHGNQKFPDGLTYIDLFCGSGISVVDTGDSPPRRFPGSPLIAAGTPKPFDRLVLVDRDQGSLDLVKRRLASFGYEGKVETIHGDANQLVDDIARHIPHQSLNIAFIDPYSLDIHFDTIRNLATNRTLDLIILFSDRFDLGRNIHKYYYPSTEYSKLDKFLGLTDWKSRLDQLADHSGPNVRQLFAEIYQEQLARLSYTSSKTWPIEGPNGPAFRLVFASKHSLGLKFCEIALQEDFEGNLGLWGSM